MLQAWQCLRAPQRTLNSSLTLPRQGPHATCVNFQSIPFLVNLHPIPCARHLYTSRLSFLPQYCIPSSPGTTLLSRGNSKLGIHSASAEKQSRFWRLGRSWHNWGVATKRSVSTCLKCILWCLLSSSSLCSCMLWFVRPRSEKISPSKLYINSKSPLCPRLYSSLHQPWDWFKYTDLLFSCHRYRHRHSWCPRLSWPICPETPLYIAYSVYSPCKSSKRSSMDSGLLVMMWMWKSCSYCQQMLASWYCSVSVQDRYCFECTSNSICRIAASIELASSCNLRKCVLLKKLVLA